MRIIIAGLAVLALAGCAGQAATVSNDTTTAEKYAATGTAYASDALTVAEASLAAYKTTANPSPAVIAEATRLDAEARAALQQYGPEATVAIAAAGSLAVYLLTSAPGNGTTPSTVPTS